MFYSENRILPVSRTSYFGVVIARPIAIPFMESRICPISPFVLGKWKLLCEYDGSDALGLL